MPYEGGRGESGDESRAGEERRLRLVERLEPAVEFLRLPLVCALELSRERLMSMYMSPGFSMINVDPKGRDSKFPSSAFDSPGSCFTLTSEVEGEVVAARRLRDDALCALECKVL